MHSDDLCGEEAVEFVFTDWRTSRRTGLLRLPAKFTIEEVPDSLDIASAPRSTEAQKEANRDIRGGCCDRLFKTDNIARISSKCGMLRLHRHNIEIKSS